MFVSIFENALGPYEAIVSGLSPPNRVLKEVVGPLSISWTTVFSIWFKSIVTTLLTSSIAAPIAGPTISFQTVRTKLITAPTKFTMEFQIAVTAFITALTKVFTYPHKLYSRFLDDGVGKPNRLISSKNLSSLAVLLYLVSE